MQIYTQIVGDKDVLKKIASLNIKCGDTIKKIVRDATLKAESTAKKEVNFDTGRLRASITFALSGEGSRAASFKGEVVTTITPPPAKKGEYSGYIGTNVKYAKPQEFGAHGKPYLFPGLKAGVDLMIKKLKSEIKKIKP